MLFCSYLILSTFSDKISKSQASTENPHSEIHCFVFYFISRGRVGGKKRKKFPNGEEKEIFGGAYRFSAREIWFMTSLLFPKLARKVFAHGSFF